jgi:hypothetical protein
MNELYAVMILTPGTEHIDDEIEWARDLARPYFPNRQINFVPFQILQGGGRQPFLWQFRNKPKTRFKNSSFQTISINDYVELIVGELN